MVERLEATDDLLSGVCRRDEALGAALRARLRARLEGGGAIEGDGDEKAIGYLTKYLTGKHPPVFLYTSGPVLTVSRSLTRRTGVTMVALRKARRLWSAREGRCPMPYWSPAEFAAVGDRVLPVALVYHFTLRHKITMAAEGRVPPLVSKFAGAVSILLWVSIAVSSRFIGLFS